MTLPVFILCRDRLVCLHRQLQWLERAGDAVRPILVDNDSSYPLLLRYYQGLPYEIWRLGENLCGGAMGRILTRAHQELPNDSPFVITDPDIIPRGEPQGLFTHLMAGLDAYPRARCAGVALEIATLAPTWIRWPEVIGGEANHWRCALDDAWFNAPVDTTMALYRTNRSGNAAIRSNYPWVAEEASWHTDHANLPADERYYLDHAIEGSASWYRPPAPWEPDWAYIRAAWPVIQGYRRGHIVRSALRAFHDYAPEACNQHHHLADLGVPGMFS